MIGRCDLLEPGVVEVSGVFGGPGWHWLRGAWFLSGVIASLESACLPRLREWRCVESMCLHMIDVNESADVNASEGKISRRHQHQYSKEMPCSKDLEQ